MVKTEMAMMPPCSRAGIRPYGLLPAAAGAACIAVLSFSKPVLKVWSFNYSAMRQVINCEYVLVVGFPLAS
jgi:hypothetical protein